MSERANPGVRACWTQRWTKVTSPAAQLPGEIELEWLALALCGLPTAAVWTGTCGLVAPHSYRRYAAFETVREISATRGWPVRLRLSGGGLVPQGPGILNITLTYPCPGSPGEYSEAVYNHLCSALAEALGGLGIHALPHAVKGSFCDGRFNLAVATPVTRSADSRHRGSATELCKIAGTAQYWRGNQGRHAVLAHALLIVDADPGLLTAEANLFEAAIGSGKHYDADAVTNVARAWSDAHPGAALPVDLSTQVSQRIVAALMQ